ncbi:LamG domain-containing protein, partial [Myxococcota bacterium]|nr:LamG domain-containing protein [Myxococcota bacterium]
YLYRNGVRVATYSGMPRSSDIAGDLFIGRFKNPGYELAGNIHQVQVYTRALDAAEITQNFDALRGRYGL